MHRLVVLSLLCTTAGLFVWSAPVAAAAQCQGEEATIVGQPGGRVDGTDGPDVIVTNGAETVYAGSGEDRVCTTAMPNRTYVSAGAGDDSVVSNDGAYQRLRVDLGPGSDRFVGGAGRDTVTTYDPIDEPSRDDNVSTGSGNDSVHATRPIGPATADADRIDLGPGHDVLAMGDSGLAPTASVAGGAGRDRISLNSDNEGTDVTIDARARTIERGGPYLHDWDSFEDYFVKEFGAVVRFEGSSKAERLELSSARMNLVHMNQGNDVVTTAGNAHAELAGGRGRDQVIVHHLGAADGPWIDLGRERIGTVARHLKVRAKATGFEDATAVGGVPLVVGDARANSLVSSCGRIRGGAGADRIVEHTPRYLLGPTRTPVPTSRRAVAPGPTYSSGPTAPTRSSVEPAATPRSASRAATGARPR